MNAPLRNLFPEQPVSTQSFYGRLIAQTTTEFEHRLETLHRHPQLINRFDDALKPFVLTPHIQTTPAGEIRLSATSFRGDDAGALLDAMRAKGFHIGEPEQTPYQFNDGFVMWTAPVRGHGLEFSLLYYTRAEAA